MSLRRLCFAVVVAVAGLTTASCGADGQLIVGATTSLQDTGLLDVLTDAFAAESGVDSAGVTPLVAGSGQVLGLARRGEVDVVVTHSPDAETGLLEQGHLIDRQPFMRNSFLLVGPQDDPAGVAEASSIDEAFRLVAGEGAPFVSRGDRSGTHVRELRIWEEAGVEPAGRSWYRESGSGQGQSLLLASDRGAYTLVDSATFAVFQERVALTVYHGDEEPNVYSVLRVNPERHDVREDDALAFADFLTSPTGQSIIEEFGRERYGRPLFQVGAPGDEAASAPAYAP